MKKQSCFFISFFTVFFFTKKDKDEFNTILKHLIKLVKNFKTHFYFFFSLVTFHIYLFFNSPVQVRGVGTEGVGVVTGEGAVFTDQGEGLRGEVSIFDLYSSV